MILRIDQREFSPAMVDRAVFAAADSASYQKAARSLTKHSHQKIGVSTVQRLTTDVGQELLASRDRDADRHRRRELPTANTTPVEIACVQVDGGRIRTRAPDAGQGVHDQGWKETKVAALWRMIGPTFEADPQPTPPQALLDRDQLPKMVREIKRQRAEQHRRDEQQTVESAMEHLLPADPATLPDELVSPHALSESAAVKVSRSTAAKARQWPPKRVFRTCVATLRDVYGFGPLVAAEAQRRGFYTAPRQAFLGDGDHKNWTVHRLHFPDFTAVTDVIHPITYLYEVAGAVTNSSAAQWEQYVEWMTATWQGRACDVIAELSDWQTRLGLPDDETPDSDPRAIVAKTITYLKNNADRMRYDQYRRDGLPVTSCLVESLIKEFNRRVKGTERFWNRPDGVQAEAILQVMAAHLSDGDLLSNHILNRPGSLYYHRAEPTVVTK